MPRTNRDEMKRDIAQAVKHIDGTIADVLRVWKPFHDADHELCDAIDVIVAKLDEDKKLLLGLALVAWNVDEAGLASYLS